MASYKLIIKKDAEKEIRTLPKNDIRKIVSRISKLAEAPRPHGSEKLKGEEGCRVRQGNYRILYLIDDDSQTLQIIKVGHRREVYRN